MSITETPTATMVYAIDAKASTFTVKAFATGVLSMLGHNPTISILDIQGEVRFSSESTLADASLRLVIQAASLVDTDDISRKDRQEIERQTHDDVLEADGFPEIIYDCPRASSIQKTGEGIFTVTLDGELTLHGVTNNQPITARVTVSNDLLRAKGDFSINQSDYDIRPVSAAGGTIKLKDELKLSFDITARKQV